MKNTPQPPSFSYQTACYFEGSLILLAIFLGSIADIDPFEHLVFSEKAIFYGILGTIPPYMIFVTLNRMPYASTQKIKQILIDTLGASLEKKSWADLLVLATIAGVSEEILFRGVIQPWMENSWGMVAGLVASSLLFGLIHAATFLYAVIATAISLYLGLCLDDGDTRNLVTPIVIHALYDFLAFLAIMKSYRATQH